MGSQLDDGLLSSRYPFLSSATPLGIRMEHPRLATPALKSWIEEVSWRPVNRLSLSFPSFGSKAFSISVRPPSCLIARVEKLVCAPAPFQSPDMGLGSMDATTPKSSATRWRRKRAIHKSSPIVMPSHGPTWNSHWAGMTSALVPEMLTPE